MTIRQKIQRGCGPFLFGTELTSAVRVHNPQAGVNMDPAPIGQECGDSSGQAGHD
jgi:hypothetical protein